jgi:DNA repair photolyase
MARQSKQLPSGGTPLEKLNKGLVNAIVTSLQDGLAFARKAGQVRLDSKALEEVWTPYYMAPPDFDAPVESRKPAHILRLALLYALLDKSRVIRVSHLDAAIAVWEYCQASARRLFSPKHQQQDSSEQKILTLLRQHLEGLTTAQITFMALKNNTDAGDILRKLEQEGKVRSETVKGKGRPAVYWFLSTPPAPSSPSTEGSSVTTQRLVQIEKPCGRALYIPSGRALEYSAWARNPYKGCGHHCIYCYCTTRMKPEDEEKFHAGAVPRPGFLDRLRRDAAKLQAQGITEAQVLLSFITDVYNPFDTSLTRPTIEILQEHGLAVCVLTKGGKRSLADMDLYRADRDCYACTLTGLDDVSDYELNAAPASERIEVLKAFHDKGIFTWVSLEPCLSAEKSLAVVRATYSFVDLYKIGKANYIPEAADIDWQDYTNRMTSLCKALGVNHYIKQDLQKYLPEGYHNPLRIDQHK